MIFQLGLELAGFQCPANSVNLPMNKTCLRRFREHYGIGPKACSCLYNDLRLLLIQNKIITPPQDNGCSGVKRNLSDFLMVMYWLKSYPTEGIMAGKWHLNEKTIRKKLKCYSQLIASLKSKKICFSDFHDDEVFLVSVDGVQCKINEPRKDPNSKWYSHKSNSAGLTYELAVAIRSNRLVWIRGPFPASQHDLTTFRGGKSSKNKDPNALQFQIPAGKRAIGDSAYCGEPNKVSVSQPNDALAVRKFKGRVKARHETFNSRIKSFKILSTQFRHKLSTETLEEHKVAFEAVCVACQYDLENDHGLFEL